MRAWALPRQTWVMASASASAASAGLGGASRRRMRVTIAPTWALSARPLPDTAALTSLGVCRATGSPRRAATTSAMPLAWAVPMMVLESERAKTRSTATASGRYSSSQASRPFSMVTSRSATGRCALVRSTLTSTMRQRSPERSLDHADPAAGQAGVDAEHAHGGPFRPNICSHAHATWAVRPPGPRHAGAGCPPTHAVVRRRRRCQASAASSSASTSAGMSTLVKTSCTSSRSSRASTRCITLPAAVGVDRDLEAGDELHVGGVVVDAGVLERGADGDHVGGLALHLEGLVEVVDLLGAGVEGRLEDVVLGDLTALLGLGHDDDALAVEQARDRAGVGHACRRCG